MIKIIIVDDHPIFRRGLASIVENIDGIDVVAESDGDDLLDLCRTCAPDVVSLDINLLAKNGFDFSREIAAKFPGIKIVMVSMYNSMSYIRKSFKSGASGFISKNSAADKFAMAVQVVAGGGLYFPREVFEPSCDLINVAGKSDTSNFHLLTKREQEIAKLFFDGLGYKEIAYKINVSPKTVESHRNNILKKTKCYSIQHLIKLGMSEGVFDL